MMSEHQPKREVTNRFLGEPYLLSNGLANYAIVRDTPTAIEYALPNEELIHAAIGDMLSRRAGGWFGGDDSGEWYPINLDLVDHIQWPAASETHASMR